MATPQHVIQPAPQVLIPGRWVPDQVEHAFRNKRSNLSARVRAVMQYVDHDIPGAREAVAELLERLGATLVIESNLHVAVRRGRFSLENFSDRRPVEDYGWQGWKLVTTAGVNYLVDAWQNSVELENFRYHALGTGTGAESTSDTALGTELTTEYNPDSTRATGSLTEGASANIFRSVGTNTLDGTPGAAIREHGLLSAASSGTLWDRTLLSSPGITLSSGDSLQSTYDMTASAGG